MAKDELSALRRRLERAEKWAIAGELAAQIAHEIKNPLAPIRGYAQLLAERLEAVEASEREVFERGLAVIREEAERIERRVAKLLSLVRLDERHCAIAAGAELDLRRAIEDAIALAKGEPDAPLITASIDASIGKVSGDDDDVRGAIYNVLRNAIEAKASTIALEAHVEGALAAIDVLDDGTGLSEEDQARAFDAFYTTKPAGTGLGLAIVRSIVEAGGGEVSIAPRGDRPGARVRMTFHVTR
jgi:signal transduction histidine kinase